MCVCACVRTGCSTCCRSRRARRWTVWPCTATACCARRASARPSSGRCLNHEPLTSLGMSHISRWASWGRVACDVVRRELVSQQLLFLGACTHAYTHAHSHGTGGAAVVAAAAAASTGTARPISCLLEQQQQQQRGVSCGSRAGVRSLRSDGACRRHDGHHARRAGLRSELALARSSRTSLAMALGLLGAQPCVTMGRAR